MSYVVTLGFDDPSFRLLDALRRRHFPAERNFLPAHLTLFHRLPEDPAVDVHGVLAAVASTTSRFALCFEAPVSLGRGVAIAVVAPELVPLRRRLAEAFASQLTRQDAAGFRPHVTVQNKVQPEAAAALYEELRAEWTPLAGTAEALLLWRYLGGPWEEVATLPFEVIGARRK